MRWTALYLKSRRAPSTLVTMLLSAVAVCALARWFPDPSVGGRLPPLALAVGPAVAAGGLAGADTRLDRTAAIDWPTRRVLHVLAIAAVVIGAFLASQSVGGEPLLPVAVVLRDSAGLTGLAALGAVVTGAPLAWLFPVVWWTAAMMTPLSPVTIVQIVAWPLTPADTAAATITAIVLGLGGAIGYAVRGPRHAH